MSKLNDLIAQYCPNGVEYRRIGDIAKVLRGKRLTKDQLSDENEYPVYHGGLDPLGYYSEKNRAANTVMIINVGASAGTVGFCDKEFWSSDGCFCISHNDVTVPKFVYMALSSQERYIASKVRHAGIPTLDAKIVEEMMIPVPPLPVQNEIVRILDNFTKLTTALTTELTTELTTRKQQYDYYCNELLTMKNNSSGCMIPLGKIAHSISSGKNKTKLKEGKYPVYGSTGIIAYVNDFVYEKSQILIARVGANAGYTHIVEGKYDVSDNTLIVDVKEDIIKIQYLYYQLRNINLNQFAKGAGQPLVTAGQIKQILIPVPSLEEQERIVAILDRFDSLCNDISAGLPAEIEARQKQYEYYRDKLLTFMELEA